MYFNPFYICCRLCLLSKFCVSYLIILWYSGESFVDIYILLLLLLVVIDALYS